MKGAADAIAAGLTDAHMQRGATQMEPREVTANGERERGRRTAQLQTESSRESGQVKKRV